jgi:hypothetical protein
VSPALATVTVVFEEKLTGTAMVWPPPCRSRMAAAVRIVEVRVPAPGAIV